MPKKLNFKKVKNNLFERVISLIVIFVMLFASSGYSYAISLKEIKNAIINAKNQATSLVNNAQAKAKDIQNKAETKAKNLTQKAEKALSDAQAKAKDIQNKAETKAKNLTQKAEKALSDAETKAKNLTQKAEKTLKDAETEANKLIKEAETKAKDLTQKAEKDLSDAQTKAKDLTQKANKILTDAQSKANSVIDNAKKKVNIITEEVNKILKEVQEIIDTLNLNNYKVLVGEKDDYDIEVYENNKYVSPDDLIEFNKLTNYYCDRFDELNFDGEDNNKNTEFNNLEFKVYENIDDFYPEDRGSDLIKSGWRLYNCIRTSAVMDDGTQTPFYACTYIRTKDTIPEDKRGEAEDKIEIVIAYKSSSGDIVEMVENIKKMFGDFDFTELLNDFIKKPDLLYGDWLPLIKKYLDNSDQYLKGNWEQDIGTIIFRYTGSEGEAIQYAESVAKHLEKLRKIDGGKTKKDVQIHLTGHSLGGYLSQFGGAHLLKNYSKSMSIEQIGYFNAMGVHIDKKIRKLILLGEDRINIINRTYDTLKKYKDIVTSYQTRGDWCSGFGTHVGNIREYYLNDEILSEKCENGKTTIGGKKRLDYVGKKLTSNNINDVKEAAKDILSMSGICAVLKILGAKIGNEKGEVLYKYVPMYSIPDFMNYFTNVHDLSAFKGWKLATENRKVNAKLETISTLPQKITKGSNNIIVKVRIITNYCKLEKFKSLNKNYFRTGNIGLSIKEVKFIDSKPTALDKNGKYKQMTYEYNITLKADRNIYLPCIILLPGLLQLTGIEDGFKQLILMNYNPGIIFNK